MPGQEPDSQQDDVADGTPAAAETGSLPPQDEEGGRAQETDIASGVELLVNIGPLMEDIGGLVDGVGDLLNGVGDLLNL